jgi:hypothetical protein
MTDVAKTQRIIQCAFPQVIQKLNNNPALLEGKPVIWDHPMRQERLLRFRPDEPLPDPKAIVKKRASIEKVPQGSYAEGSYEVTMPGRVCNNPSDYNPTVYRLSSDGRKLYVRDPARSTEYQLSEDGLPIQESVFDYPKRCGNSIMVGTETRAIRSDDPYALGVVKTFIQSIFNRV